MSFNFVDFVKTRFVLLILCCFAYTHAHAATVNYDVQIEAPDNIKTLLEKNLDIVRWRGNALIDGDQFQRLYLAVPEQVTTLVATEGYYEPRVEIQLNSAESWVVSLRITLGSPVLVGKVDLVLQGFAGDVDKGVTCPRPVWSLKEGALFRQADWEAAKSNLLRQVVMTCYPRAKWVETVATVDTDTRQAQLKMVLDSGSVVTFGALQIEGLQRYPASMITNLNPIKAGTPYSEAALLDLQGKLQDTGYFSSVDVSAELDSMGTVVPIIIKLQESKRKKASVGVGYSTNTGNRTQLTYDDLYVPYLGVKLKTGVTLETKRQTARGELLFPVTASGYQDSLGTAFERNAIEGEVTHLSTLTAKRAWGSSPSEYSVMLEYLSELKNVAGVGKTQTQSLPLTYSKTVRNIDSLLFPTKGTVWNAQIGGTVWGLSDQSFLRASSKVTHYYRLGKQDTVIVRAEAGVVAAKDRVGIPSAYLFRAGGDQSVRGYAYQELGVQEGDATVGGRYLATASTEYQHWWVPRWGTAIFYDVGNAADRVADLNLKSGYGLGARWKSPVGPINMDVAYGRAVKTFRLHFSLGLSF